MKTSVLFTPPVILGCSANATCRYKGLQSAAAGRRSFLALSKAVARARARARTHTHHIFAPTPPHPIVGSAVNQQAPCTQPNFKDILLPDCPSCPDFDSQEAVIECHPLDAMTSLISSSSGGVAVLKLWRRRLSRSSTASSVMSSAFASAPPSGVVPWRGHIPELQSNLESALEAHADEHTERGSYGHMRLNRGSRSASCQGSCSQSRESSRLGSREESFKYVEELRQTAYDASRDEALGEVNELSRQATSTDNLPTSPILGPFDSPAANAVALGAPYASLNRRSMNVLSHEDAPGCLLYTSPSPRD